MSWLFFYKFLCYSGFRIKVRSDSFNLVISKNCNFLSNFKITKSLTPTLIGTLVNYLFCPTFALSNKFVLSELTISSFAPATSTGLASAFSAFSAFATSLFSSAL